MASDEYGRQPVAFRFSPLLFMLSLLGILGSLGVFLYGMKVLSEAIQKAGGQRMRFVMATMTRNRLSGVLTGFGITSLLQSSSATTVIVVSFVNAGLLTLIESIGVIMGANLGTTLTAWIIAAVGKFSISKIAIPIIGVGLPLFFIGKGRLRDFGEAAIGFGLLFLGLGLLKEAVPDADLVSAQAEKLRDLIQEIGGYGYLSYLAFLVIGVFLTLIVQSSSAAMAITVTFAINGWIGFEESACIVLGENIGTTVTAWLASLGASANAKRAARAHFLFNVLGVAWMLLLFPVFAQFVEWLAVHLPAALRTENQTSDIGFKLAIFHTAFNFCNVCLLIGFVPWLAKIVSRWVPEKSELLPKARLTYFDQALVRATDLNLPEAERATVDLARLTKDMFEGFVEVFDHPHADLSQRVVELRAMEEEADEMTEDITEYLVRCSAAEVGLRNATQISQMIHVVAELETITDTIFRLVKFARRRYRKEHELAEAGIEGVRELSVLVARFIDLYNRNLFQPVDLQALQEAESLEEQIDRLRKELNRLSMERIDQGETDLKTEILNMEVNNHLERIGNFCLNVMQALRVMAIREEHPEQLAAEVDKMTRDAAPDHRGRPNAS